MMVPNKKLSKKNAQAMFALVVTEVSTWGDNYAAYKRDGVIAVTGPVGEAFGPPDDPYAGTVLTGRIGSIEPGEQVRDKLEYIKAIRG